ncbi:MAG TPA: imidazole glycerol phosphate synthase subunit HisH [Candidatus Binatia bacterium]|nr:imidazole glycerol phosphate synthase subunit HisH [Candidatus Binatia bacterium]
MPVIMIAIIDYGMGNLRSVQKGFEKMGYAAEVTRDARHIEAAAGVVLPGVGAFGACMAGLAECGLVDTVYRIVAQGTPLLGICVGMQILFSESVEFGRVRGLDILKGRVVRFGPTMLDGGKVPHMGWNQLHIRRRAPHLDGIADGAATYFVHSYYPVPDDLGTIATTTDYGGTEFVSSVWWRNIFATQFHPEKSQAIGLRILGNFGRLVTRTALETPDSGLRSPDLP